MRDSAQNMDRKNNLKSVIKAKTNISLVEFVHMTEKKNIFVEHFLKHLVHRRSNYYWDKWSKKVILYSETEKNHQEWKGKVRERKACAWICRIILSMLTVF